MRTGFFRKMLTLAVMVGLLAAAGIGGAGTVQAASKAATNKKAHAKYDAKVEKYRKSSTFVTYKYVDITGDGIHEAIIEYHPGDIGSGRWLEIFTYKSGKAKRILKFVEYGAEKFTVYKKSKSLILLCGGHGSETYLYFKMKKGKYKLVAGKGRASIARGGFEDSPWSYDNASGKEISKSAFNKLIKGIKKGKKKTLKMEKWTTLYPNS